ncbi:response regulator [Ideonella sp. 4Y16]|uniref:response regulator n=1 Tax=Ideonella alba TaxID=2824118 RepID=UPI001B37BADB|nr:response regulator [Ideonella alba]MBQ0943250.1 response regulator [Ideonella alba]
MERRTTVGWSLALLLAGLIAAGAGTLVHRHNAEQREQRLDRLADRAVARVESRVRTYEYGLRGARGAVVVIGLDDLTRYRFQSYIATRDLPREFPGAHGFGFIRRIDPSRQTDFVNAQRRDGRPDFSIRQFEPHDGDLFVIEHIEPEAANRVAAGLDIASEPRRRRAAEEAERRGQAILTGPITLVQQDRQLDGGLLMLLPVFDPRGALDRAAGWVYAPLLLSEVMAGYDYEGNTFALVIDDITDGAASPQRGFLSAGFEALATDLPATTRSLDLYGRRWRIGLQTTPAFIVGLRETSAVQVGVAAFLLQVLLLGGLAYYLRSSLRLRQAHEDHAQLAAIVENSIDAIIGKRGDGVVTSWNRAAELMFGYTREQALGRPLAELIIPPELLDEEVRILGRIASGERVSHFDTVRRTRDGRLLNVSIAVSPIRDERGHIVGASKTVRDITLQKETELRIRQLNATLEQQVAERTRELFHALESAQQAAQAKSAFLANMSHEIRTPMNAVLGLAYLAERQSTDPTVRSMVAKIGESGRSLLRILNDVLDFSKIEQGRLELEATPFDLQGVLDRLATMMGASVGDKPVELVIAPLPPALRRVVGDPTRLEQVLANLVGNAIKFTANGYVQVAVRLVSDQDGELLLRFVVQDSGIGIPSDKLAQIFAPFTQVDASTTRRFGGTGLGLAICRELVTLMGGEIGAESVEGRGSEFWFTARLRRDDEPDVAPRRLLGSLQVLLADDNAIALDALQRTSEQLGWRCQAVGDGEAALAAVTTAEQPPDVLVLDWQMPMRDGLAVARALKEGEPQQHRPVVIMVTAHSREQLSGHPDAVFVDSVLAKPVTASALYDAVARAMRERGLVDLPRHSADGAQRLAGTRVLLVDDSDINRELARRILEAEGAVVEEAADGEQAVRWMQQNPSRADLVLMDIQMPVMDGLTATGMIRQIPGCAALPVLALTAGAFASDREAALAAGVSAVVTKPFNIDHTVAVIRRLIDEHRPVPDEAPAAAALPDPATDGLIDFAAGQRIWGDPTIYHRYLDRFFGEYAGFPAEARELPLLTLGRAMHKFRGAASAVCLPALVVQAQAVEEQLVAGRPVESALASFAATMEATLAGWERYREALTPSSAAATPQVVAALRRLVRSLESQGDPQAAMAELASQLPEQSLSGLRAAVSRGDRRAAADEARALGHALREG